MPAHSSTTVSQDNFGAILWTKNVKGLPKIKHSVINYHYARDAVGRNQVEF